MRIIATTLLALLLAGSAWADPPASQPNYTSFYNCKITAIGEGALTVHSLRGHSGIIHPVNVDEKTEVILLNGQPGKLTDLRVGQWIKVHTTPDPNNAKEQRVVKIEPGMAPWAAQRLADLEKNAGSLEVGIRVFVNGKGDEEELFLLGPDNKSGYKEPFFARLTKDEMTKLLRYLAVEGFLADAFDQRIIDTPVKPPDPPYMKLLVNDLCQYSPLGPETLKRLEVIKTVLPDKAAAKMEGLLLPRVRKIVGVSASQPATQPSKLAAARAEKLKADLKTFTLSLDYSGPQDKPYYNLLLRVPKLGEAESDHLRSPFFPLAQITEDEAKIIIDHLAVEGFLDKALDGNRNKGPVRPNGPLYTLTVRVENNGNPVIYEEWLGWNLKMLQRLDGLRKLLQGDAAKGMDFLLTRMSGHRKEWERQATSQPDVARLITDLSSNDGPTRVAATKAIFALGKSALEPLAKAGARQVSPFGTISTRRIDIVCSLLDGLKPNPVPARAGYSADSFGIRVEQGCTREDVTKMGERHGFAISGAFQADTTPSCYVKLKPGKDLAEVLRAVLSEEPKVISVNLNYFES